MRFYLIWWLLVFVSIVSITIFIIILLYISDINKFADLSQQFFSPALRAMRFHRQFVWSRSGRGLMSSHNPRVKWMIDRESRVLHLYRFIQDPGGVVLCCRHSFPLVHPVIMERGRQILFVIIITPQQHKISYTSIPIVVHLTDSEKQFS